MTATLYCGDALAVLKTLPEESVQCVVTSPPYWRQRDYGIPGQLGLEQMPEEYVARLVEVFREVRRVLTDDGSLWLNLGDKWAHEGKGSLNGQDKTGLTSTRSQLQSPIGWGTLAPGYKSKDLIGIPWMTAFALRDDGWYLRQCNVWAKPNTMPESVTDRSTISHEYVFMLTKSATYFYNAEAARTPAAPSSETRLAQNVEAQRGSERANGGEKTNGPMKAVARKPPHDSIAARKARANPDAKCSPTGGRNGIRPEKQRGHSRRHAGFNDRWAAMERADQVAAGANLRSVWWIAPAQYRDAHFAVMPLALAEICILCGSAPGDAVLDPFCGSGTTAAVAVGHGRSAIGIDLNPKYLELARQRIGPILCQVGA